MIIGMSSVSFGKSYLCISNQRVSLEKKKDGVSNTEFLIDKYKVETSENDNKIISVKVKSTYSLGKKNTHTDSDICVVGEKLKTIYGVTYTEDHSDRGIGESIKGGKGGNILSCRHSYQGSTNHEFVLRLSKMTFNFYLMVFTEYSRYGYITSGKCEEI